MEGSIQKRAPLTRKIKRLFDRHKGIDAHKLYPEEYFKRYWFNETDSNGIKAVARMEVISKKAAAHLIFTYGFKRYMGLKWKEELDAMATPEGRAAQASRTRYYLELRRLCRERGWDINKIF
jgi:hypothetical protein